VVIELDIEHLSPIVAKYDLENDTVGRCEHQVATFPIPQSSPNHIQHKGVSITNAILALTDLVYLQFTALAFANVGYKFVLVIISICELASFILWFILPETKGIPL
jgi:hypothetical protein